MEIQIACYSRKFLDANQSKLSPVTLNQSWPCMHAIPLCNTKESGYCYRAVPVGCLKKPYELKECPRDIADLDWPESKKQKEDQDLWDWTSEVNSADWTISHVQITHRIPVVICDHLIQGMTLSIF